MDDWAGMTKGAMVETLDAQKKIMAYLETQLAACRYENAKLHRTLMAQVEQ
jgi:hypothetical protein